MPASTVIPVLAYPSVAEAVAWLSSAFGFTLRLGIGDHRAQLNAGDGAIVVTGGATVGELRGHDSVMIRVADARAHCARARAGGATIAMEPTDFPYGERQYTAIDFSGRAWTFSESIADVDPRDWGGDLRQLGRRAREDARRSSTLTTGVVCVRAADPVPATAAPLVALAPVSQWSHATGAAILAPAAVDRRRAGTKRRTTTSAAASATIETTTVCQSSTMTDLS